MITVFSSNGIRAVLLALAPEFERTTGHTLAPVFDPANVLKDRIDRGEAFDMAILTESVMDEAVAEGRLVSPRRVARVGCGLAVRAGAPHPEIGTVDAFKRALLQAKSIAATTQGASGIHFARVAEQLGIAEEVGRKATLRPGGLTAEFAARGEVELAVQLLSELKAVAGVEIVGPFPADLQHYVVMVAGVSATAKEPAAAAALIEFLTAPSARPVIAAKGMEAG